MLSDPVLRVADLLLFLPRLPKEEKQRRVILGVRLNYVVNRLNLVDKSKSEKTARLFLSVLARISRQTGWSV